MHREVLLDNEYFLMWIYPDQGLVFHRFKKYVRGVPFREMLMVGMQAVRERGVTKWLSDDRDMPLLSPFDEEWGRVNWFPDTVAAGWKYWAIVRSENREGYLTMKRLVREYCQEGVTAKFFTDPDEAFEWIVRQ